MASGRVPKTTITFKRFSEDIMTSLSFVYNVIVTISYCYTSLF